MKSSDFEQSLKQIPANRKLIEDLYAHGKISSEAKRSALGFLYPRQWGLRISQILISIGATLLIFGIANFLFHFIALSKISPVMKLYFIQFGITGCLFGAYFYSLKHRAGQALLLTGSLLVGLFLGAYNDIYQTGYRAYQIYMMWSLLTLGWTVVSNFAQQWIFWLLITDIFLAEYKLPLGEHFFEKQAVSNTIIVILNGAALALREYLVVAKAQKWLEASWIRSVIILPTLFVIMLLPILEWQLEQLEDHQSILIKLSIIVSLMGYGVAYYVYRYRLPDMIVLTATVLCACIISLFLVHKIFYVKLFIIIAVLYYGITHLLKGANKMKFEVLCACIIVPLLAHKMVITSNPAYFLIVGFMIIAIFYYGITHLLKLANEIKSDET